MLRRALTSVWRVPVRMNARFLNIHVRKSPNPLSLTFMPEGNDVMGDLPTREFRSAEESEASPLASRLFKIKGVQTVCLLSSALSVNISEMGDWDEIKPSVFVAIQDFYKSGDAAFTGAIESDTEDLPEEQREVVELIKEILTTQVRPIVQGDGGDIIYHAFDPHTGIVSLEMKGACSGCPSSQTTLKQLAGQYLSYYVPEVKGVEEYVDPDAQRLNDESDQAFQKLLEQIRKEKEESEQEMKKKFKYDEESE